VVALGIMPRTITRLLMLRPMLPRHLSLRVSLRHRTPQKILSNLPYSAQTEVCIVPDCAFPKAKFNASTLSNLNSFFVSIQSSLTRNPDTLFHTLIDCGSSHCFVDPKFISKHQIPTSDIPLIRLCLLDGTSNSIITQAVDLPIRFPTGEDTPFTFYVTPLDSSCLLMLGLNWLTCYNLSIDWELRRLTFRTPPTKNSIPTSVSSGPVLGPKTPVTLLLLKHLHPPSFW
jgi:hypothetical protein